MSLEMSGAEMVLKALAEQGVEHVFGYPGGAVLPIYDQFIQQEKVKHILVRHEQGAAHAAEGYARSTGKCGVMLVTSGPGATNAVTGLTDALLDSIPIVCISGQVPTHLIGSDAFQECDTVGITRPCTKHNYLVRDVNDLARVLHEAFYVATSGRPGPVVVDIPKDVQFALGKYIGPANIQHKTYKPKLKPEQQGVRDAVELMLTAKKPVFYTGGGVINSGPIAAKLLRELVKMTGFPITSTLMGLGAFPASDKKFLGMLGMHGTYEANMAMHDCDVMINIGARFDDRITGRLDAFSPGSRKIHVDIDPASINKVVRVDIPIVGDVAHVLEDMIRVLKAKQAELEPKKIAPWLSQIEEWRKRDCLKYRPNADVIMPQYAVQRLYELTKDRDTYITTEVGQHQMWAAQFYKFEDPNRWMTSGGLGTMGYGLPAAIGVQVAHPKSLVIDIAGDASVLMNMQEMSTAAQYSLPIKVFILNNEYMGMVRQWQQLLHGNRLSESYSHSLPDFVKLAEAYGGHGIRCDDPAKLDDAIREMMDVNKPVIFDCRVANLANCLPMIPSGKAHNEMLLGEDVSDDEMGSAIGAAGKALV
ncbi:MAG: acetolactate synthase 3 large subunit [Aestuariivirgaceae bacterium]|nr:acetolactate synthase 3 large subunit [Aestuariivirgaceae bacterium]